MNIQQYARSLISKIVEDVVDKDERLNRLANVLIEETFSNYPNLYKTKPRGLVLSGGGINGIYHLGMLQYLDSKLLLSDIDHYSGTSIGAIICYFLSIGYTVIEIFQIFLNKKISEKTKLINLIKMEAILDYREIEKIIQEYTLLKFSYIPTLLELKKLTKKDIYFCTLNKTDEKIEYISYKTYPNILVTLALRMSYNLPIVFDSCYYNNKIYIDGYFGDNLPFEPLRELLSKGSTIVGILLLSTTKTDINIFEKIYSILNLSIKVHEKRVYYPQNFYSFLLDLNVESSTLFDTSFVDKLENFLYGHKFIKQKFEK